MSGSGYVGGLVGVIKDYSRVINCYSYADITGGDKVGGIVGYNNYASANDDIRTMVMNCMFYGDISGGTDKAPIYNGSIISNAGNKGLANYNFYWSGCTFTGGIDTYNCALAADEKYLTRFELYRRLLNSNGELAAWYATGSTENRSKMCKWVLLPENMGTDHPFPVLAPQGKYRGNQASYTTPAGKDDPTLNVKSFTSIGQIFGGGFGVSATVEGNPVVNINVIKGEQNNGNVTAGTYNYDTDATEGHFDTDGNFKEWTVEFQTSPVTVPAHSKGEIGAIGNVFGGGNEAKVDGNTEVNIGTEATVKYTSDAVSAEGRTVLGADIRYNIYGGGNQADVTGKTNVTIGRE